ncbi:MAG: hypothetical protein GF411_16325 [Candidatus Lokiarchaeota archaeon]|nr:hypothetical protein [Candidatus Lokiarchaeota archaeon]
MRIMEEIKKNWLLIFTIAVLVITLAKRLAMLDPHILSWDEVVYITQARELAEQGLIMQFEQYRPPLWPMLLGIIFLITGYSPIVAEITSWLIGIGMLFSFWKLYNKVLDEKEANLAYLLTLSLPIIWLNLGGRIMSESLMILFGNFFLAIVIPKAMKLSEENRNIKDYFLAGIFLGLSILTRFTAVLLVIPVFLAAIFYQTIIEDLKLYIVSFVGMSIVVLVLPVLSIYTTGTPLGFLELYSQVNSSNLAAAPTPFEFIMVSGLVLGYLLVSMILPFITGITRGLIGRRLNLIVLALWLIVPVFIQIVLRLDTFHLSNFDLGSGGLFVRLAFPWIAGTVMLAAIELNNLFKSDQIFIGAVLIMLLGNCVLAGVVLTEYRTSSFYQEIAEVRTIIDGNLSEGEIILTNWITFIYPYGRDTVLEIPSNKTEYNQLIVNNVSMIIQHKGNRSIEDWWNPSADGFSLLYTSQGGTFSIWTRD